MEELQALATDLVRQQVDSYTWRRSPSARSEDCNLIPTVFAFGGDPVDFGLVSSLSRPEGNITGVTFFAGELGPKRLELLRELSPQSGPVACLMGPT